MISHMYEILEIKFWMQSHDKNWGCCQRRHVLYRPEERIKQMQIITLESQDVKLVLLF